jgi:hypothetical protein
MAQIASGGGWTTMFTLVNLGSTKATAHLSFFDDAGNPLPLPLSETQSGSASSRPASTFDQSMAPNSMVVLATAADPKDPQVTGWADLQTDGGVTGFASFQYLLVAGGQQEAVVPLETRNAASYALPFDNTAGYVNGVAIANIGNAPVDVAVAVHDAATGGVLSTDSIALPARGHVSFTLDRYPATAGIAGLLEFTTAAPGQISVIGLRSNPSSAFTSTPVFAKR